MNSRLESVRASVLGLLSDLSDRHAPPLLRLRRPVKFLLHLSLFLAAYALAYLVRFDFSVPQRYADLMGRTLPILLVCKATGFLSFGLFRGWWRYISIRDILPIAGGCALGSGLFAAAVFLLPFDPPVPRSIYLLDFGILLLLALAVRFATRMARELLDQGRRRTDRKVLLVGAGSAGRMIAREIRVNPSLGMTAEGFVDDDPLKIGTWIEGLRVLGGHEEIERIATERKVEEIVIAIPSADAPTVRHIVEHCRRADARFRILPGVAELINGTVSVRMLRDVALEDLLGRAPVTLDTDLIRRDIAGKVVLVTGAAGSIGSELCRQVARLAPDKLVLFEIAETALFELETELREAFPEIPLRPVLGDIRDRERVEEIFALHRPAIVYHAAAYKHVPVVETHPVEAVKTNVVGTAIVADAAARHGAHRFVLVSTDKAVRPANVMGATKRVAELVIRNMNGAARRTVFVAVRFGNVLGSAGSVVPIFRRQLATTGRITVTHPEASRYFMLVQEAAGLILQAGAMGVGGEVFLLDMGEPVRIAEMARTLIRLSGNTEGVDARIVYTGLRPGEKLREELVVEGEEVARTAHPKVLTMIGEEATPGEWTERLGALIDAARAGDRVRVVSVLDRLVKGYTPDYRFHGIRTPAPGEGGPFPESPEAGGTGHSSGRLPH